MSWWNASNFTDLASKALKNAQKKIDSALDIKDDPNSDGKQKADTSEGKTSKGKSDLWGAWTGITSGESAESSSWSFPWGSGADGGKEEPPTESLVKVKSAEEIKSEVLKAAKERSKAKAKLFPKTVKAEAEANKKDVDTVPTNKSSEELRLNIDTEQSPDTSQDLEKDFQKDIRFIVGDRIDSGLLKVVETPSELKEKTHESTDVKEKDKIAQLEVSITEEVPSSSGSFTSESIVDENAMTNSGFQEVNEADVSLSDLIASETTEKQSEMKELHGTVDESKVPSETLNNAAEDLVNKELEIKIHVDESDNKDNSTSDTVKTAGGNSSEAMLVDEENDSDSTSVIGLTPNLSSGDISSSVEIVTDRDFPAISDNVIPEPLDFGEQGGSDPEIIETDTILDEEYLKLNTDTASKIVSDSQILMKNEADNEQGLEPAVRDANASQRDSSQEVTKVDDVMDSTFTQVKDSDREFDIDHKTTSRTDDTTDLDNAVSESFTNVSGEESRLVVPSDSVMLEMRQAFKSSDSESSVNKLDSSMDTCTSEETLVELNATQESAEEKSSPICEHHVLETETEQVIVNTCSIDETIDAAEDVTEGKTENVAAASELEIGDDEQGSYNISNISPAHSFVKCMLEDATEEGKHADDNSDSHSSIEKSEGSRYSNHESGDEIDTTTSSDIEIISYPTSNGESRQISPLDPIPLRMALQKTSWRGSPTHRRTDSSDSSSASGGNYELSPGRECSDYTEYHRFHSDHSDGHSHPPELPALCEEDDNPYHPQRLLKDDTNMEVSHDLGSTGQRSPEPTQNSLDLDPVTHDSQTELDKKMAEMAEVLKAREEKLLQLSKENCDLMEANSILSNQLKQSEEAREAEMTDVNELTTEFTQRLTEAEKRVSNAIKEKETIKQQLQDAQGELAKRAGDINLKAILTEKEEQIAGLLQEGEKLSKSQLQSNTIIKKLRQKEKDNESTLTSQKKKIETQTAELEHLRKVLDSKEELEKKQTEAIAQLSSAVKKQEQEMVKLKSEHEDAIEKARGLQVALDNSYKEMAELHRSTAAQDSKAQEAALSAEMHVREELKMSLEKQQQQHKWTVESLNMQIEDHRLSLTRMEKEYNRREDLLKQEIADLHKQLQEDEARTQELTQGVSLATRPLLRQIENLQATFNAQTATWEKVEKNLSERLNETQNQLAVAMEKERTASEQLMELGSKVTALETQNTRLRQERSQMNAQLEMLKTKVEMSEDAKHNEAAQIEMMKQQMAQEMQELKKEKVLMETQLDVEKSKVEQERKKIVMLQDQIKDLELEVARSRSRGTPVRMTPSPISVSRQESMMGSLHEHSFSAITQDELDRSFVLASANGNKQSLYEALRQSGAANLLENLQSQLKLREGEISHLQSEIRSLERTRESMARELVDLSNKNDSLEEKLHNLPLLESQYKDLDQRYNALLQMYGEKTEEAEELKLDLQDVKDMYKAQINHLLGKSS